MFGRAGLCGGCPDGKLSMMRMRIRSPQEARDTLALSAVRAFVVATVLARSECVELRAAREYVRRYWRGLGR
jgi:hypothetical protein